MNTRIMMALCFVVARCYGNDNESQSPSLQSKSKIGSGVVLSAVGDSIYGMAILAVYAVRDIPYYVNCAFGEPESYYPCQPNKNVPWTIDKKD